MYQNSNTSSEGPLLTADTSTVRPEDLGSVFQRFHTYQSDLKRKEEDAVAARAAATRRKNNEEYQNNRAAAVEYPNVQQSEDGRIRHHFYRRYHHEESMAMPRQDVNNIDVKQLKVTNGKHIFGDIESPHTRGAPYRNTGAKKQQEFGGRDDESPTKQRLRMILEGDEELYYDDEKKSEEIKENEAKTFRRTIIIIAVICLIAVVGALIFLAKCGDGNPWKGLMSLLSKSNEKTSEQEQRKEEDEKDDDLTMPQIMQVTLSPQHQQATPFSQQQQLMQRQREEKEEKEEEEEVLQVYDDGSAPTTSDYANYNEPEMFQQHNEAEGTPVMIPKPLSQPNPMHSTMQGPASLVPGAENRSREDMSREMPMPSLGKDVRNIYGNSRTTLLGDDGRQIYERSGGAAAERFLGMSEPPPYDPSADTTLNQAENASKSMMSLYNSHQKKIDPRTTSFDTQGGVNKRPQKRSDTQPLNQIQSCDENYGATHQKRKEIAAKSQSAVSDIYTKKQIQRSATSSTSAAFVHDPATNNGNEYMDVHSQTYLGDH